VRRAGFTLLEVMIALAILASALVATSDVVTGALRNHLRAQHLEVATLLARGKMAALEQRYEWKGFRIDDEEEGTFEDDGHPEVKWRLEVKVPPIDATPDSVLRALTGSEQGLAGMLPSQDKAPQLAPFQAALTATLQGVLVKLGQQLKRGVRQVKLTVSWPEGAGEESFAVTTHMVVLAAAEGQPVVSTPAGGQPAASTPAGGQTK
jgi:general secretion pathway protein I